MCVYIFGRFTFKILGQALLLWFIFCFFTLNYYYLLSLFISITIIFTIISIIAVTIINYIVINFQFFTTLTTYILSICWFPFVMFSFSKLYVIIFCGFLTLSFVQFFFPNSFPVFTVNCDNKGRIQINEFERHSSPPPFNSDW